MNKETSMRTMILTLISTMGLLGPTMALAQGTLYVSNIAQTPTGSAPVGSDSWIAQRIITGTDPGGYSLDSVELLMDPATGSPSGFNISIYSSLGGEPYNNLGNLVGSDPSAGGVFSYSSSGVDLSPSTFYFVVVTAAKPVAQGAYDWSAAQSYTPGTFTIDDGYFSSNDGSSWSLHARQDVFQLAIYATAAPEPGIIGLFAVGGLLVAFLRRKARTGK